MYVQESGSPLGSQLGITESFEMGWQNMHSRGEICYLSSQTGLYMTDYFLNVPSQKFPVPKITKQTKSHSLNFNVLSSVIDSSGEEV